MADACLAAIGVETSAVAVARHYGARVAAVPAGADAGGLLDGWLVHDATDATAVELLEPLGIATRAVPLLMTDLDATAAIACATMDLAEEVRR